MRESQVVAASKRVRGAVQVGLESRVDRVSHLSAEDDRFVKGDPSMDGPIEFPENDGGKVYEIINNGRWRSRRIRAARPNACPNGTMSCIISPRLPR